MLKYFRYEAKKNIIFFSVITVLATALLTTCLFASLERLRDIFNTDYSRYEAITVEDGKVITGEQLKERDIARAVEECFSDRAIYLAIFLCIAGLYLPTRDLAFLHKKRSLDCYYALPLSHKKIISCKVLLGLITIILSYTVLSSVSLLQILSVSQNRDYFSSHIGEEIPRFFLPLLYALALYLFNAFIFGKANKTSDGVIWIIGYTFIGMMAAQPILKITENWVLHSTDFSTLSPIINRAYGFTRFYASDVVYLIFLAAAIVMGICFLIFGEKKQAENAEQRSDSFWGYRTLIPLFTASMLWWTVDFNEDAIFTIMGIIFSFILSCIYAGTVKHRFKTILPMLIGVVIGILLLIVFSILPD